MSEKLKKILKIFLELLWIILLALAVVVNVFIQIFKFLTIEEIVGMYTLFGIDILIPVIMLISNFILLYKKGLKKTLISSYTALLVYICILLIFPFGIRTYVKDFTPEKWAKCKYSRIYMLDDIMKEYELENMSKEEVINIFGEPRVDTDGDFNYVIGEGYIDPDMLCIKFKNGKVSECYTYGEFKTTKFRILV